MTTPNDDTAGLFTGEAGETIAETAVLTADERAALDAIPTRLSPPAAGYAPAAPLPTDKPVDSTYLTRTRESIPAFVHGEAAPKAVREKLAAYEAAYAADRASRDDFASLPRLEAAEKRLIGEAAVAGRPIPEVTDWATKRVVTLAIIAERARLTKAAAAEIQAAIKAALPQIRETLLAEMKAQHASAKEALAASGVVSKIAAFHAALSAAREIDAAIWPADPAPDGPVDSATREVIKNGRNAAQHLQSYLASTHDAVNGSFLLRKDELRPTRWAREAISAEGNLAAWSALAAIEEQERYRFTSLTREERSLQRPDPLDVTERSRVVDGAW